MEEIFFIDDEELREDASPKKTIRKIVESPLFINNHLIEAGTSFEIIEE